MAKPSPLLRPFSNTHVGFTGSSPGDIDGEPARWPPDRWSPASFRRSGADGRERLRPQRAVGADAVELRRVREAGVERGRVRAKSEPNRIRPEIGRMKCLA